jgi:cell division protein FtsB
MSHKRTGNTHKMIYNQPDWASRKDFEQLKREVYELKQEIERLKDNGSN